MNTPKLLVPALPGIERLMQALGFHDRMNEGQLEAGYAQAYNLYERGQYLKAGRLFCLLGLYSPTQLRLWHGMALCGRQLKDYPSAVSALLRCLELEPGETRFAFEIVDCLCLAGERPAALQVLDQIIADAQAQGATDRTERAQRVKARLQGQPHEAAH